MRLEAIVDTFIQEHHLPGKPVLLAFSGGPDSLVLFHLLRQYENVNLHVAHVDHGWRHESAAEAEIIQKLADELSIPCHMMKLNPDDLKGNLEEACREERLNFFSALCQIHRFQAVVFGHHADDQAETVLKKIFEGKSLMSLSGMQQVSFLKDMTLWRPLLNVRKKEIIAWHEERKLKPFEDSTNADCRFLRARFRKKILPFLNQEFGKEMVQPIRRLASDSEELNEYLKENTRHYIDRTISGPLGTYLDFNEFKDNIPLFELKYVVRKMCEKEGLFPSYEIVNKVAELIANGSGNKSVVIGKITIHIDRKRLFFPTETFTSNTLISLNEGSNQWGSWKITVTNSTEKTSPISWKDVWKGHFCITLPKSDYQVGLVDLQAPFFPAPAKRTNINHWWTNHKIPAFLRHQIPVIWNKNGIAYEFLSGHSNHNRSEEQIYLSFFLSPK